MKAKLKMKVREKPREIKIPKPHVKSRRELAKEVGCAYHAPGDETQAEEFCGAWVNDGTGNLGSGHECHKPLCRDHADVRLQLWLCAEHGRVGTEVANASL